MNAFSTSPRTILVVEDDHHVAELVKFRLMREGFEVRHAADGEQALRELDHPALPDLVIMDVMLPYHSGYELLAEIRRRPAWAQVPVIMLTGRSQEEDVLQSLKLGANDYLSKPFSPAELMARVQRLLAAPKAAP